MPSGKPRLYVALYPSGVVNNEERKYHWALLVGPKSESAGVPGMRYHVKNTARKEWRYEEVGVNNVQNTVTLLARIVIGKVKDGTRLIAILRGLSVVQNDPSWRCRTWVANALAELAKDGKALGTSQLDWAKVEETARQYVGQKIAAGRYEKAEEAMKPRPTWDMLQDKETVP